MLTGFCLPAPAPGNDWKMKKSGCASAASVILPSRAAMPSSRVRSTRAITCTTIAEGHHRCWQLCQERFLLLLVVHRCAFELLALRIGSTRCGRASLAIRRHDNSAGDSDLSAFLDCELQRVIINLLVRSRI